MRYSNTQSLLATISPGATQTAYVIGICLLFIVVGFCLGSILFSYWIPKLFKGVDIRKQPEDHNPGAANAFMYGGIVTGTLCLICDLAKGGLPVFLCRQFVGTDSLLFVLVMAAPVLGHAFPFFRKGVGGKAIAVSFGVMLGLAPQIEPLIYLIIFYLLFSLVIVLQPHALRSVVTFACFSIVTCIRVHVLSICLGCILISVIVIAKHLLKHQNAPVSVRLFRHAPKEKQEVQES